MYRDLPLRLLHLAPGCQVSQLLILSNPDRSQVPIWLYGKYWKMRRQTMRICLNYTSFGQTQSVSFLLKAVDALAKGMKPIGDSAV